MNLFGKIYHHRRVLITGHTGFKGSWLCLWLKALGAEISGIALDPPTTPNHWSLLGLDIAEHRLDIRDHAALARAVQASAPQIVFHLAAQPLVRRSYVDPIDTWSANALGTVYLLEACRRTPGVQAVVVVTSDKCYHNREWLYPYRETDRLGGRDPYSASKAAAELAASSYREAFFRQNGGPLLATARAGNVIGGGDWAEDRLVPDLVRAITAGARLQIRYPQATRPWQHVLEPLSGYLLLGWKLIEGETDCAQAWNFGPDADSNRTVAEVLAILHGYWPELDWQATTKAQPHEAALLHLDSSQARHLMGWRPVWGLNEALFATAEWHRRFLHSQTVASFEQLQDYLQAARDSGQVWTQS
jgi:CDP-glucose 4,6-dehydratase